MNVIKCDTCEKEMEHGKGSHFELKFNPDNFFLTNTTQYNLEGPPVYHFCNKRCVLEWAKR
ncbi:hypothetical protein COK47_25855 [Bacillus cereus]|nr:hypothetical protein COK47_25855 [Bacillus cereus]